MLKIAAAQLQALSEKLCDGFVEKTIRHLEVHFPEELSRQEGGSNVGAFVRTGLAQAKSHGITHASDIRLYIECMLLLRPDFGDSPEFPWATKILREHGLSGTEKMNQIHDYLVFSVLLNPK